MAKPFIPSVKQPSPVDPEFTRGMIREANAYARQMPSTAEDARWLARASSASGRRPVSVGRAEQWLGQRSGLKAREGLLPGWVAGWRLSELPDEMRARAVLALGLANGQRQRPAYGTEVKTFKDGTQYGLEQLVARLESFQPVNKDGEVDPYLTERWQSLNIVWEEGSDYPEIDVDYLYGYSENQ